MAKVVDMEKRELWQATFGRAYDSNEAFEADFGRQFSRKLPRRIGTTS